MHIAFSKEPRQAVRHRHRLRQAFKIGHKLSRLEFPYCEISEYWTGTNYYWKLMESKILEVTNEAGIHARPAVAIVETASRYESEIYFTLNDERVNAKSIMNILLLAAGPGTKILVEADGKDEKDALESIAFLFSKKFKTDN